MIATQVQARKRFESLFAKPNPTRDEMFMRPDFRLLAGSAGLSFGECWDVLQKKARDSHDGNLELAAAEWYAQITAPRL